MNATSAPVHFLLVDDLEENLLSLEALLRAEGLVLLKAKSGPEALELLLRHDVALALLDVQMPGMDGFELAELMRGSERTKRVPIIFLTAGSADRQRRFRGYEAGAVDFIHKPIEPDILRSKAQVFYELYGQRQRIAEQSEENARLLAESRQSAAALKAADQRKDEFLANMSHEIRTPMNAVVGLANILMRDKTIGEKQRKWVETLQLSAQSLMGLINDLLDISKIESDQVELESMPVDLRQLVKDIVSICSVKVQDKKIPIELSLDPKLSESYLADPTRLKQVLMNLISNALKFTEQGNVLVSLAATQSGVSLEIADTGIGIPEEKLESIFSKFSQADSSITRKYGGTGLGLPISKQLIELMGGSIEVRSTPGKGSVFTVLVPLKPSATQATGAQPSVPQIPEACDAQVKLLLVEDYAPNVLVAGTMLDVLGYRYDVASNGEEAIRHVLSGQYSLALMDVQMPDMDGLSATRLIREQEAADKRPRTPIIGVTAHALAGDREKCLAAGMDDYIAKPFQFEQLRNKIQHQLQATKAA